MLAALSHGLDVIEFLARERKPVLLGAVAAAVGMSKAGTHRILATLCARGFVARAEGGLYSLGYKAWETGWAVPGVQLVPRAAPVMQRVADAIGDGATLGALDTGFDVVYLHVIDSRQAPPAIVVKQFAVLLEIADQLGTMARTLARLAKRVELQRYAVETEVIPQAGTHQDLLGIDVRAGKAE